MVLSGGQRKQLQFALESAFPTKASLEQMLSYELDKNLEAIAGVGSLQDVIFKVIQTAEAQGWIPDLIRAALQSNPGNPELKAFETKSSSIDLLAAKESYLKQLRQYFDDITFAGIDLKDQDINQPGTLAKIFVMPDVEEQVLENSGNELLRQGQQVHQAQRVEKSERKVSAKELFKDGHTRRVLLLGTPGSGKTALINYFVLALCRQKSDFKNEHPNKMPKLTLDRQKLQPSHIGLADDTDWLPIIIPIRELARHLDMSILDFARYFAEKDLSCSPLPQKFFEYWLEEGRALIFFDGLDEVGQDQQSKIVERIKTFLEKYAQNRAIITSRPIGNPGRYFQAKEFSRYWIQPFNNIQIACFIHHWYHSYCSNQTEVERRKTHFKKALFGNERLTLLARNPLLLTIILLIHREYDQLPKERCELYNCAINTLLRSWDQHKELRNHDVLQYLRPDDLRWLMARLAYWIHTQGGLDNKEGGILIERGTLIEQLSEYIQNELGIKRREAKAESERFLEKIVRDRAGLLSLQGDGCYAFVHKTFQEYLTAEDMCNRAKEQPELKPLLDEIQLHLHEPHWHEVILLLVAQLTGNEAAQAIRAILECNSEYEQWLHRDLLLAGQCLAENPKRLKQANPKLVTDTLTQLVKLGVTNSLPIGQKTQHQFSEILLSLSGTDFAIEVIQILNSCASTIPLIYRLALGEHEEAVRDVLPLLKNKYSHEQTTKMLEKVVKYSNISNFLIQQLRSELHWDLGIAKALRTLGYNDGYVRDILMDDDYDEMQNDIAYEAHEQQQIEEIGSIYSEIEQLLRELKNQSELALEALDKLIDWLEWDDYGIGEHIAKKLGEASSKSRLIEMKLLDKLQDIFSNEYIYTVLALGYLRNPSQDVIKILVSLLESHKNGFIRVSAAKALSQLNIYRDFVLNQLLNLLRNSSRSDDSYKQDLSFNYQVFEALVQLSTTFDRVAPALAQWIEQHQDKEYVVYGIDTLWKLVEGSTTSYEQ